MVFGARIINGNV